MRRVDTTMQRAASHAGIAGAASTRHARLMEAPASPGLPWFYPAPKDAAKHIAGYVAFWHGVVVER
jgi:uncharacterized protein (DUF427 family)